MYVPLIFKHVPLSLPNDIASSTRFLIFPFTKCTFNAYGSGCEPRSPLVPPDIPVNAPWPEHNLSFHVEILVAKLNDIAQRPARSAAD